MKFLKFSLIIIFLVVIGVYCFLQYIANDIMESYDNPYFKEHLKKHLKNNPSTIDFKDLTNFEWDKVCFYVPYDYKTHERDPESSSWILSFYLQDTEVYRIFIKNSLVGIKEYFYIETGVCYPQNKIFAVNNNYIILKDEGRIK